MTPNTLNASLPAQNDNALKPPHAPRHVLRDALERTGNDEAPAAQGDYRGPDAELIALGAEFDSLHAAWVPLWRRQAELGKPTDAARQAAIDTLRRQTGKHELSDSAYMAVHAAASAATGMDVAEAANDAAMECMNLVADQIRDLPATTAAGLLVKARVLLSEVMPAGDYVDVAPEGRDWPAECFFGFLADIERLAGRPS
ncbi:hypothetical protein LGR54_24715 [Ancylobacter sp. Lp-2]|uniref:hypothetical protein n=1 Tax=Ancylobacter sp. Lp-2 TaxID=2881339 RepID=UPI001E367C93|nr:hypothetical protein [Ancylobacter sp. Lp-2]MCB4771819.1 hypothetical protein [Ancylobacter sp. Lp-2]